MKLKIIKNHMGLRESTKPELTDENGWSTCQCDNPDCDLMFIQKSTILHALKEFTDKYKDLPITIELIMNTALVNEDNPTRFAQIGLKITQTDYIHKKDLVVK